jgi:hypothetical protein
MKMIRRCVSLLTCLTLISGCGTQQPKPRPTTAETTEPPGYPLAESILLAMRDRQDTAAIRKHAWAIFAEITKSSSATDPAGTPLWDTWVDEDELFSGGTPPSPNHLRSIQLPLEMINAIRSSTKNDALALKQALALFQPNRRVGTETKYNDSAAAHIREEGLTGLATFQTRAATFNNLRAPVNERSIAPFPGSSIIVKATWRTVGPDDIQSIPAWDPPDPGRPGCASGCKRTVKVKLAPPGQPCIRPANENEPYWSSCFYTVPDPYESGYLLLLFGLHVITKETAEWTWSTFWWQPDPDQGKFAYERPAPTVLRGFWRNYVMDSTLSMQTPPETQPITRKNPIPPQRCRPQPSTTAKICFNPFIEGMDGDGTISNCMTCHILATYPALQPDVRGIVQRGYMSSDDPCFGGSAAVMKVDYVWKLSPIPNDSQLGLFLSSLRSALNLK